MLSVHAGRSHRSQRSPDTRAEFYRHYWCHNNNNYINKVTVLITVTKLADEMKSWRHIRMQWRPWRPPSQSNSFIFLQFSGKN